MALIHRTKTTHCYSATAQHFQQFFSTLTQMYEEQAHTDVHLVSSDGTVFGVHRMVLGGPSAFLRNLIPPEEPCECNTLTIILPDFSSKTIKNLLGLLYTGSSAGDCNEQDLRQLLDVLGLDVLETKRATAGGSSQFKVSRVSATPSNNGQRSSSSVVPLRKPPAHMANVSSKSPQDNHIDDDDNDDEMVEVTPEVSMFIGNHFMSDMMNGGSAGHSEDESGGSPMPLPPLRLKKAVNLLADPSRLNANNESPVRPTNGGSGNGGAVGGGGNVGLDGDGDKQFLCRLCGRSAPSGAALFAHLLYPHFAHLWRTEIPHRANQYLCKQCPYTTTKRQHFVQHVAKVHEDLKKKLIALGENIEVLDNLNPKNTNGSTERIVSKVAKFKTTDDLSYDDNMAMSASEYSNINSPITNAIAAADSPNDVVNASITSAAAAAAIASAAAAAHAVLSSRNNSIVSPNITTPKEAMNKANKLELSSFGLIPGRFPRGYKPFVKCRLCGKGWKGKDNFFTHLVSTHFKHLWSNEVPKHADMFHCHVGSCQYQSKYRYNFLFHLAGKHKQLKEKLAQDGISLDVLVPIEVDEVDEEMLAGGSPTILKTQSMAMQQHFLNNETNMQKFLAATAPPLNSGGGGRTPSHGKYSAANSTVRLICRVCKKISFNHTCHRQHVVSKHFQDFWADKTPDQTGLFHCHHCDYQTPNRSVFVIHLAYTHSELKSKLKESGNNPDFADPDVYGKRKYRRSHYDNTQHLVNAAAGGGAGGVSGNTVHDLTDDELGVNDTPIKMAKMAKLESGDEPLADHDGAPMPPPPLSLAGTSGNEEVDGNGVIPEKIGRYACRLCKTEFAKEKAIVEHLALAHFYQVWEDDRPENGSFYVAPEGPFVCQHCPFTSSARATFIAHFVNQHDALKSVMSLQYGDKSVEDLYTISSNGSNNEDETYDEGDDEEDDIDDDEENAPEDEDLEDEMDDEMDLEYNDSSNKINDDDDDKLPEHVERVAEAASGW